MNLYAQGVLLAAMVVWLATPVCASDLLDSAGAASKQLLDRWRAPASPKPPKPAPQDMPADWRGAYIYDEAFDCDVFVADLGAPGQPTLMLVHGLGQNGSKDWLKVIPALKAHYRIVLVDLPGFGYSDKPPKKLSPTTYAQLLHRIKQHLAPHQTIAVVGHSMGGAVTLRYADLYPRDVAQMVLVDVAGILQRTAFVKHSADGQVDVELDGLPNSLIGYAANLQDFGSALIEKLLTIPDPTSLLTRSEKAWGYSLVKTPNLNAALALAEEDFSRAVHSVGIKTAIIWGEKDPVAPLRTGQVLARALSGDQMTVIAGAEHVPMNSHPVEFNQALLAALTSTAAPISPPVSLPTLTASAECTHAVGNVISGYYRLISIKGCKQVSIVDAVAERVVIEDSLVSLNNLRVEAPQGAALSLRDSVIIGTNVQLSGEAAIEATHSRVDLAGARLSGQRLLMRSKGKSRVIMSVSEGVLSGTPRYLHGDFRLQDQRLEDLAGFK